MLSGCFPIEDYWKGRDRKPPCVAKQWIPSVKEKFFYENTWEACCESNCNYVLKVQNFKDSEAKKNFKQQIDFQKRAAEVEMAPEVVDYWTCDDAGIIVFEKPQGFRPFIEFFLGRSDTIYYTDLFKFYSTLLFRYLKCIQKLNIEVGIEYGANIDTVLHKFVEKMVEVSPGRTEMKQFSVFYFTDFNYAQKYEHDIDLNLIIKSRPRDEMMTTDYLILRRNLLSIKYNVRSMNKTDNKDIEKFRDMVNNIVLFVEFPDLFVRRFKLGREYESDILNVQWQPNCVVNSVVSPLGAKRCPTDSHPYIYEDCCYANPAGIDEKTRKEYLDKYSNILQTKKYRDTRKKVLSDWAASQKSYIQNLSKMDLKFFQLLKELGSTGMEMLSEFVKHKYDLIYFKDGYFSRSGIRDKILDLYKETRSENLHSFLVQFVLTIARIIDNSPKAKDPLVFFSINYTEPFDPSDEDEDEKEYVFSTSFFAGSSFPPFKSSDEFVDIHRIVVPNEISVLYFGERFDVQDNETDYQALFPPYLVLLEYKQKFFDQGNKGLEVDEEIVITDVIAMKQRNKPLEKIIADTIRSRFSVMFDGKKPEWPYDWQNAKNNYYEEELRLLNRDEDEEDEDENQQGTKRVRESSGGMGMKIFKKDEDDEDEDDEDEDDEDEDDEDENQQGTKRVRESSGGMGMKIFKKDDEDDEESEDEDDDEESDEYLDEESEDDENDEYQQGARRLREYIRRVGYRDDDEDDEDEDEESEDEESDDEDDEGGRRRLSPIYDEEGNRDYNAEIRRRLSRYNM